MEKKPRGGGGRSLGSRHLPKLPREKILTSPVNSKKFKKERGEGRVSASRLLVFKEGLTRKGGSSNSLLKVPEGGIL